MSQTRRDPIIQVSKLIFKRNFRILASLFIRFFNEAK